MTRAKASREGGGRKPAAAERSSGEAASGRGAEQAAHAEPSEARRGGRSPGRQPSSPQCRAGAAGSPEGSAPTEDKRPAEDNGRQAQRRPWTTGADSEGDRNDAAATWRRGSAAATTATTARERA